MRRRGRVYHQRAGIADIGQVREKFQVRYQGYTSVVSAFEAEGEDRAGTLWRIFACELIVLIAGKTCVAHRGHRRVLRQPLRDLFRVITMFLHAQRERFDTCEDHERVEW